jgi:hypothetical protein
MARIVAFLRETLDLALVYLALVGIAIPFALLFWFILDTKWFLFAVVMLGTALALGMMPVLEKRVHVFSGVANSSTDCFINIFPKARKIRSLGITATSKYIMPQVYAYDYRRSIRLSSKIHDYAAPVLRIGAPGHYEYIRRFDTESMNYEFPYAGVRIVESKVKCKQRSTSTEPAAITVSNLVVSEILGSKIEPEISDTKDISFNLGLPRIIDVTAHAF